MAERYVNLGVAWDRKGRTWSSPRAHLRVGKMLDTPGEGYEFARDFGSPTAAGFGAYIATETNVFGLRHVHGRWVLVNLDVSMREGKITGHFVAPEKLVVAIGQPMTLTGYDSMMIKATPLSLGNVNNVVIESTELISRSDDSYQLGEIPDSVVRFDESLEMLLERYYFRRLGPCRSGSRRDQREDETLRVGRAYTTRGDRVPLDALTGPLSDALPRRVYVLLSDDTKLVLQNAGDGKVLQTRMTELSEPLVSRLIVPFDEMIIKKPLTEWIDGQPVLTAPVSRVVVEAHTALTDTAVSSLLLSGDPIVLRVEAILESKLDNSLGTPSLSLAPPASRNYMDSEF